MTDTEKLLRVDDDKYYIHRYYELLNALRDLPVLPPPLILDVLSHAGKFPEDWEEGKRIQREYGLDAVPPVTECEIGAGFWHRVVQTVPVKPRSEATIIPSP